MIGGVEAGGTTFRCAVADNPLNLLDEITIPTTSPEETLEHVARFFEARTRPERIGIASFGPLCLDKTNARYGSILETPKQEWRGTDILGTLSRRLNLPCVIDTDVAAAVLAEHMHGAAKDVASSVYITVGTGIGAASLLHGSSPTSRFHEEMGHMLVPRHPDDHFASVCIHENCLEGLASAPALAQRWGSPADELPTEHVCWDMEAYYLAVFCVNVTRVIAPDVILFGGGVAQAPDLIERTRTWFRKLMHGYHTVEDDDLDRFIQHAALEPNAGLIGALCLATPSEN